MGRRSAPGKNTIQTKNVKTIFLNQVSFNLITCHIHIQKNYKSYSVIHDLDFGLKLLPALTACEESFWPDQNQSLVQAEYILYMLRFKTV